MILSGPQPGLDRVALTCGLEFFEETAKSAGKTAIWWYGTTRRSCGRLGCCSAATANHLANNECVRRDQGVVVFLTCSSCAPIVTGISSFPIDDLIGGVSGITLACKKQFGRHISYGRRSGAATWGNATSLAVLKKRRKPAQQE